MKTKEIIHEQKIKYACVYDLECNCSRDKAEIAFNEVIEFPVVIIDTETAKVVSEFHVYVRPTMEAQLNPFCTELTGITDQMVLNPNNPTLDQAFASLHHHLLELGIFKEEFVFVSCGDFDGRQLSREAEVKNLRYPNYLKRWINLKKAFPKGDGKDWRFKGMADKARPTVAGMEQMLQELGLELEGRHHSGIDDARNIAKVLTTLLKKGFKLRQSMVSCAKGEIV